MTSHVFTIKNNLSGQRLVPNKHSTDCTCIVHCSSQQRTTRLVFTNQNLVAKSCNCIALCLSEKKKKTQLQQLSGSEQYQMFDTYTQSKYKRCSHKVHLALSSHYTEHLHKHSAALALCTLSYLRSGDLVTKNCLPLFGISLHPHLEKTKNQDACYTA